MTTDTDTAPAEQAADLAALTAAASEGAPVPGAPGAAQQADQGPQQPSAAALQIAAMAVGMLRPIVAYAVPTLKDAPDALWEPVPEGVAAVMDHYGASAEWLQSPWARLAFSLAPLIAFAAVKAMEAPPPAKPESIAGPDLAAKAPAATVGSNTVTFGAPVPGEAVAA